jgi:hypothetical protein
MYSKIRNIGSDLGFFHHMDVKRLADVSVVNAASIFMVEVNRVTEYSSLNYVYFYVCPPHGSV